MYLLNCLNLPHDAAISGDLFSGFLLVISSFVRLLEMGEQML